MLSRRPRRVEKIARCGLDGVAFVMSWCGTESPAPPALFCATSSSYHTLASDASCMGENCFETSTQRQQRASNRVSLPGQLSTLSIGRIGLHPRRRAQAEWQMAVVVHVANGLVVFSLDKYATQDTTEGTACRRCVPRRRQHTAIRSGRSEAARCRRLYCHSGTADGHYRYRHAAPRRPTMSHAAPHLEPCRHRLGQLLANIFSALSYADPPLYHLSRCLQGSALHGHRRFGWAVVESLHCAPA
jgi:hypothetical protein